MHLGRWEIDDLLTFTVETHNPSTGAETDADSVPTYRVYEDETGTAIQTGSMALLDDSNTTGFYSEQITLSAANGYEEGKSYRIRISATVGGVTGSTERTFQVEAAPATLANQTTLLGRLTAARAGYLDTLNGLVAAIWAAVTDSPGVTTLLNRLTSTRAGYLDSLPRLLGLSQDNWVMDGTTYDSDGNLTAATIYLYDSAANAATHDGVTGLIGSYAVSGTITAGNLTLAKQRRLS